MARSKRLRKDLRDAVFGAEDFDVVEVFDTVYNEITPDLVAQRQQLLTELAKDS
jgi:pyruvate dehydrogenase E1 component alpha subunit